MSHEERDQALYRYPNSETLRNKLDIRDAGELERAEKLFVRQRMREDIPTGRFDLDHLSAIHHHLFQDVYDWAGETRQVDFHKGETFFLPQSRIPTAMDYVHKRLEDQNYLRGQRRSEFAQEASSVIGEINYAHPFREGNGRTQLLYLKQLGQQAGHNIDLTRMHQRSWVEASIEAAKDSPSYDKMRWCIDRAIVPDRDRSHDRGR